MGVAVAAPGDHIRSGNAEVVPAVEAGVQHQTNVFNQEGQASGGVPIVGGTNIFASPSLDVAVGGDDAKFNLGLGWTGRKYIQRDVWNLDRFTNFNANAGLELLQRAVVGARLRNDFIYTGWETESAPELGQQQWQSAETYHSAAYIDFLNNQSAGRISVHPGGPLELDLGGDVAFSNYTVPIAASALSRPGLNSRLGYGPAVDLKWRFLPKTALVVQYNQQWFYWKDNFLDASGDGISREEVGDHLGIPDGQSLHVMGGLRGRFTDKLVLGATVGYGRMLFDENSVLEDAVGEVDGADPEIDLTVSTFGLDLQGLPDGVVAQGDIAFEPTPGQRFKIGYVRDFQDVFFTNYVAFQTGYFQYGGLFANVVGLDLGATYRYEDYEGEVIRQDHFINANSWLYWKSTRFLDVGAGVGWTRRASADGNHPEIEYDNVTIRGGVVFTY